MTFNYKRDESEPSAKITGRQRCVITGAEEGISKSGNEMIVVKVRPSGCRFDVKYWLVNNEYFNRNATQFFDSFPEIEEGNFNLIEWIGCEGAAMFGLDENDFLELKYFISADRAKNLPPFEGDKPEKQTVTKLEDDESGDPDDLPFSL